MINKDEPSVINEDDPTILESLDIINKVYEPFTGFKMTVDQFNSPDVNIFWNLCLSLVKFFDMDVDRLFAAQPETQSLPSNIEANQEPIAYINMTCFIRYIMNMFDMDNGMSVFDFQRNRPFKLQKLINIIIKIILCHESVVALFSETCEMIKEKRDTILNKENSISELKFSIQQKKSQQLLNVELIERTKSDIENLQVQFRNRSEILKDLVSSVEGRESSLQDFRKNKKRLLDLIHGYSSSLEEIEAKLVDDPAGLQKTLGETSQELNSLNYEICNKNNAIDRKRTDMLRFDEIIQQLTSYNNDIEGLKTINSKVRQLNTHSNSLKDRILAQNSSLENLTAQLKNLKDSIQSKEDYLAQLNVILKRKTEAEKQVAAENKEVEGHLSKSIGMLKAEISANQANLSRQIEREKIVDEEHDQFHQTLLENLKSLKQMTDQLHTMSH